MSRVLDNLNVPSVPARTRNILRNIGISTTTRNNVYSNFGRNWQIFFWWNLVDPEYAFDGTFVSEFKQLRGFGDARKLITRWARSIYVISTRAWIAKYSRKSKRIGEFVEN